MKRGDILKDINQRFKEDIIDLFDKSPARIYIEIKPSSLIKVANTFLKT